MISAIDLFCGLGGWSTAAVRSGRISVQAALNHNDLAIKHHALMHPRTSHLNQDAGDFPWEMLGRMDLILASPSCVDFTTAGQPAKAGRGGNGKIDLEALALRRRAERNTSWAVIAAVTALEPWVVLVENVQEMYQWNGYKAWNAALSALGYNVRSHVINAADCGGAVDRPRAIITASRGAPIELSTPPLVVASMAAEWLTISMMIRGRGTSGSRSTPSRIVPGR